MMNVVVLVGRLAKDPEMKYTPSGMPITTFRLAVDRGRKNDAGEDQTDWLNIVAFQKTAELVAQYCDKGSIVGIEGRIQTRDYDDASGKKQTWVEIVANNVRFLESRSEAERRRAARGQSAPAGAATAPPAAATRPDDYGPVGTSDDPFGDQ